MVEDMWVALLSTKASQYFADLLVSYFDAVKFIPVERKSFGDGERYYRIGVEDRTEFMRRNAIVVGSIHSDDDIMELYRLGCTIAASGAQNLIFVLPFMGYSTMERATKPGEVVTAKANIRLLSSIPRIGSGPIFFLLDLHTAGLIHYFEGGVMRFELLSEPVLVEAVRELGLSDFVFASADLGRSKWVERYANTFGVDVAFIRKERVGDVTKALDVIGEVSGKVVVIYDDMIRSAGTLVEAAYAYFAKGATEIYAVTSHLALHGEHIAEKLRKGPFTKIIATNSHPMSQLPAVQGSEKFAIKDVSHIFADAIRTAIGVH